MEGASNGRQKEEASNGRRIENASNGQRSENIDLEIVIEAPSAMAEEPMGQHN